MSTAAAIKSAVLPGVCRSPIGCTTEDPSPAAFTKWCAERSVLWPKCGMAVSAATGRCVVATQDIKQGEVVVEVPDDAVLMGENCQIQELLAEDGLLKPAEDALLEVQGLILAVMFEKALGVKSSWAAYLAFLPTDISHMPLYWTDSELEELRGTAAHDKMLGRVQHPADAPTRMSQLFEELVLPFVQSHGQACKVLLGGKDPEELSEEAAKELLWPAYCWATAAVASYSFVLGDDQYQGMVPVWDLLNHITGAVNVKLHHDQERGVLQMIATQDIPTGAEVVNCYGQLSNAELLRGYGYVEQHNSIQHVQVPAQFLIRAAAGAAEHAAAAANAAKVKQGQQQAGVRVAPGAVKQQQETAGKRAAASGDGEGGSGSDDSMSGDASDSNRDDAASSDDGDDGASSSDAESSSDDEDEPDWDLEDDDEPLQKQQQQPIPSLHAAQQQIPDWEDRWQLCFSLKLLPKNGVFQVPLGGVNALPQQLLPALLLLLADAGDCEKLSRAAGAATSKAAAAAAAAANAAVAAAAAAAGKEGKGGSKQGKKHTKRERKQQDSGKGAAAGCGEAAAADSSNDAARAAGVAAAGVAAVAKELARVDQLQFCAADRLLAALQLLVRLMQSRYSCSLQEDEARLQQQQQQQQARLAAAVLARVGEKRVLAELAQALQRPAAAQQLMQQARQALRSTLQQLVQEAAAAAVAPAHDCCRVPGCTHDHHEHEHSHKHGTGQQQQQQQQQQQPAAEEAGGNSKSGKKRKQRHEVEEHHQQQHQQQQHKAKKGIPGASHHPQKATSAAAAAAAGSSGDFAFNFKT